MNKLVLIQVYKEPFFPLGFVCWVVVSVETLIEILAMKDRIALQIRKKSSQGRPGFLGIRYSGAF